MHLSLMNETASEAQKYLLAPASGSLPSVKTKLSLVSFLGLACRTGKIMNLPIRLEVLGGRDCTSINVFTTWVSHLEQ